MEATGLVLRPYGWPVIVYLALAALAAGAALAAIWLLAGSGKRPPGCRTAGRRALVIAAWAIGLGGLALIADLESPSRFGLILRHFNPASMIAWGARAITLFGLLTAFAWWLLGRPQANDDRVRLGTGIRALLGVIALLAVFIGLYPGWFLMQATARPLWSQALIAPLFLVSALHAGLAVGLLVGRPAPAEDGPPVPGFATEVGLVVVQAVLLGLYMVGIGGYAVARDRMLTGSLAPWLWGGVVLVGWLLPWLLARRADRGSVVLRACAVMIGVVALRAVVILGGQGAEALMAGLR